MSLDYARLIEYERAEVYTTNWAGAFFIRFEEEQPKVYIFSSNNSDRDPIEGASKYNYEKVLDRIYRRCSALFRPTAKQIS